jgi:hypothetical protein
MDLTGFWISFIYLLMFPEIQYRVKQNKGNEAGSSKEAIGDSK